MKTSIALRTMAGGMSAALLAVLLAATTAEAQTTPLQGQLVLRPVTPGDVSTYKLATGTEVSGGLTTVGIGTPVYLDAEVNIALPATNTVSVTWALTVRPQFSGAVIGSSPLGTNIPVYEPSDRLVSRVAGRALFRPDLVGQYTVTATIVSSGSGSTNVSRTITAGTYMGANTCALCHSGGVVAENRYQPWQTTAHASIFTQGINGVLGSYSISCLPCHTVGYDTNTNAVDGGFDDVAKQLGWVFPTVLTNNNWAYMQATVPSLAGLANIQCENCHGPGSQHAFSLGNTNYISVTVFSGDCNQCHDAPTHHVKGTEWYKSVHAVTTTAPAGNATCVGCHTSSGFIDRIEGVTNVDTSYSAIGCQACHEPHGLTMPTNNPHLLRTLASFSLLDGTVVTTNVIGEGVLCMECHHSRQNATNYVETTSGSAYFGPHEGPQADMFLGVNGVNYGQAIPSSAHRNSVTNACVTCHMQATATTDPTFLLAGGHTFNMSCSNNGTNYDMVAVCVQCHGSITTFDFPREDYNGDGVIQGVQTEVQELLNQLGMLLPPLGQPKTALTITSGWTRQQLRAGYNYLFVQKDGSLGVHNVAYAVGLLKASISDLTGDPGSAGLLDPSQLQFYLWQNQYFGSASSASAAPNATPAGDGVPNWLKFTLGLNPLVPGIQLPNGVVWANAAANQNGSTNTIQIYTAAEVSFNTTAGTTYQLQSISSLIGGWQNVGSPITATNTGSMSFLTPMRQNVQQFFRVNHNP